MKNGCQLRRGGRASTVRYAIIPLRFTGTRSFHWVGSGLTAATRSIVRLLVSARLDVLADGLAVQWSAEPRPGCAPLRSGWWSPRWSPWWPACCRCPRCSLRKRWNSRPKTELTFSLVMNAFNETVDQDAGSGPGSAARRMCRQYQNQISTGEVSREHRTPGSMGYPYGYYFGPANHLEFPHMALLGYGEKDDIQYACGGSLISPDFVLTAAHCIAWGASPVRWVLLGALNRSESPADKATRQLLEVAQVIPHPQYSAQERYHDIALLRLATSARVEEGNVRPACLHTDLDGNTDTLRGELAVVTGWGAEAFGEDGSERLLKGKVFVRALAECSRGSKGLNAKLPRGLDPETHVCAGGDGTNPTDACNGDSGGPLQFPALQRDPACMFRVAGVVSFGPRCGLGMGQPGVYTKVAYYVPWIESYVWPSPDNSTGDDCVPGTGPGTTARRACQRYLGRFCGRSLSFRKAKPGLRDMERCHLQETVPPAPAGVPPPPPPPPTASGARHGGFEIADDAEFPHQVLLSYGRDEERETECSGVLIAPDYVLTAAHCAKLGFGCGGPVRQVLFGKRDLTSLPIETVDVAAVVVHPEYDQMNRHNDVALLRLAQPVRLGFQSRPACLQTHGDDNVLAGPLTASGMTATGRWEDVGGGMRKVAVAVENAIACKARIASLKRDKDSLKYFTIPGLRHNIGLEQLCTKEGAPTVPWDIGSPIQVVHRVLDGLVVHRVAGILSQRSLCGSGLPDVYTNVADVVPWIESVVWPET